MSLKEKFNGRLANLDMNELDKLKNMEEAINEDGGSKVKLIVVKDQDPLS
ncbi:hypothetical protein [Halonatronum saccharophilum]|nr:hypothetical protein [Halonatronum saccharophilum]